MQKHLLNGTKKAKIGKWFILICVLTLIFAFYLKEWKTALYLFVGYAIFRIILNYFKRDDNGDYY
jgi:uncharacterized membrane-anchored protein YitT (DUF2179 family)